MSDSAPAAAFPPDMTWRRLAGLYALVGFPEPAGALDLELSLRGQGGQVIREGGETTLLLSMEGLAEVLALHPGAKVERDLGWYRFEAPMDWDLVGFLAGVSSPLAAAGVPLGAVCAFSRDYLVIAEKHAETVSRVLLELFPRAD